MKIKFPYNEFFDCYSTPKILKKQIQNIAISIWYTKSSFWILYLCVNISFKKMTFLVQTLLFFDQLPVQIFKWIIIDQITRNKIQERIKQIMALHTQTQKSICNYLWFKTFKLVLLESACSFLQLYSNNNANKR